jgi:hypothetical protein
MYHGMAPIVWLEPELLTLGTGPGINCDAGHKATPIIRPLCPVLSLSASLSVELPSRSVLVGAREGGKAQ